MSVPYVQSFLDPFDLTYSQPKLHDGSVPRSSGVRLRTTGQFQLNGNGGDNFMVLFPGFDHTLTLFKNGDTLWTSSADHPSHFLQSDRPSIKKVRYHSCGLKLSLLNSSDENEGLWEAVRLPYNPALLTINDNAMARIFGNSTTPVTNMANYSTYQSGKLKDLERVQFKLNSTSPNHAWVDVNGTAAVTVATATDSAFDIIVIKLNGRVDAVTPSLLSYQTISNQEVVYAENTALSRLSTPTPVVRDMDLILDRTKYELPGVQIA